MQKSWAVGVIVILAVTGSEGAAQTRRPMSPSGSSATQLGGHYFDERQGYTGGKWLKITYGRPITRGRDLFGPNDFEEFLNDGAPVWRAGANISTRLFNELPIELGGKRLPPGEYTLFIELTRGNWILIVSTLAAQTHGFDENIPNSVYGAYGYTPDRDMIRVSMQIDTLPHSHDQLHWEFLDITPIGGRLAIFWANRMASVPFLVSE